MTVSDAPSTLKKLRQLSWKFQQTFQTPVKNLAPFVDTIVSTGPLQASCITIEQVVFEPKNLLSLLTRHSLPPHCRKGTTVTASGLREVEASLQAAFSDAIDFLFVPNPRPFVIYADHDEYTTFYASTRSNLNRVVEALSAQGFDRIKHYTRPI